MDISNFVIQQLPYLIPTLLLYVVGIILSLVFFKRMPRPAMFSLVGCSVLFIVALVFPFLQGYVFETRHERGFDDRRFAQQMMILSIGATVFRIIGFSLVLTAVFVGRRSPRESRSFSEGMDEASQNAPRDQYREGH